MYCALSFDKDDCKSRNSWFDGLESQNFRTIIRVGDPQYPDHSAGERGFVSVSCDYDEEIPSPGVVSSFLYTLRISETDGVVVICDGTKGRAATLCALHLMHKYGFSAGEATTWLRLMCPSIQLAASQEIFLYAVGSGMEDGDNGAGGRDMAFRRSVYRVWAKDLRRDFYGKRPQSAYEKVNVKEHTEPERRENMDIELPLRRCNRSCWELLRSAELPTFAKRVLWAADYCSAEEPGGTGKLRPAAEARAVPLQLRIK